MALSDKESGVLRNWLSYYLEEKHLYLKHISRAEAVFVACYFGHTMTLRKLLGENSDDQILFEKGLYWASQSGQLLTIELLLSSGVQAGTQVFGCLPQHAAVRQGNFDVIDLLLKHKSVNMNAASRTSKTPISYAAIFGHSDIVELLVRELGSDAAKVPDKEGRTPLSWAAGKGNNDVVELLMREVSNDTVDLPDVKGRTPLSHAAGRGNRKVVDRLLQSSVVSPLSRDRTGRTPLSYAASRGQASTVAAPAGGCAEQC